MLFYALSAIFNVLAPHKSIAVSIDFYLGAIYINIFDVGYTFAGQQQNYWVEDLLQPTFEPFAPKIVDGVVVGLALAAESHKVRVFLERLFYSSR